MHLAASLAALIMTGANEEQKKLVEGALEGTGVTVTTDESIVREAQEQLRNGGGEVLTVDSIPEPFRHLRSVKEIEMALLAGDAAMRPRESYYFETGRSQSRKLRKRVTKQRRENLRNGLGYGGK